MSNKVPSAAATRQQFRSIDDIIDNTYFGFDSRGLTEAQALSVLGAMRILAERIVDEAAHAFLKGAERGIQQTARLMVDPEFYAVTKGRRAKALAEETKKRRDQRAEDVRKMAEPRTPQEIAYKRRHLLEMQEYHTREMGRYKGEREQFETTLGQSILMERLKPVAGKQ